jgi:NAD(P)-dependent dehydrogenase (short-subunit alcohol dehydrogenase family)
MAYLSGKSLVRGEGMSAEARPPRGLGRLAEKVALVTGAGSRGPGLGNGKATAILFAREGAHVLCVDMVKERAEETVGLIRADGGSAEAFAADVTRAGDCADMVADTVRRWGGLDILHNNVGIESRKDLLETTEAEWDQVLHVDLKSTLLATQSAARLMIERGGGAPSSACHPSLLCAATGVRPTPPPRPGSSVSSAAWPSSLAPRGSA